MLGTASPTVLWAVPARLLTGFTTMVGRWPLVTWRMLSVVAATAARVVCLTVATGCLTAVVAW